VGDRVDVAAHHPAPELQGLVERCPAARERVEDNGSVEVVPLVEAAPDVLSVFEQAAQDDGPEDGAQARRSPRVDVGKRSVNLLAPAFQRGNPVQLFKGESGLDGSQHCGLAS
jgi:hypothetical protein